MKKFFFVFLVIIANNSIAQFILQGKITSQKVPVINVSVSILYDSRLVAYGISNLVGEYKIKFSENFIFDTSFALQFSCIGYQKKIILLNTGTNVYNVELLVSDVVLPDVLVKSQSLVIKKGDTTTYNVSAFTAVQDRVIGDVLKRIPGIEVQENGKILFNGKAISNFYIDGDDLLDDRYNIATNTLPAQMVDKVQMLENHQPVKALKNIQQSDNVALNIKLKNSAKLKLHGTTELGAGLPENYDFSTNILGFFNKHKFINSIKANNIGNDIKKETLQLNYQDFLKRIEKEETGQILSPEINNHLPINPNRYFENNSLLLSINELVKLKKEIQLKINLSYLPEKVSLTQNLQTIIYLPNDTIKYNEVQLSNRKTKQLFGDFSLTINKPDFYITEKLSILNNYNKINGLIERNFDTIHQTYKDNMLSFANDFSILKVLKKKHIVNFFSYLSYAQHNEIANWEQGLNANALNDSVAYARTIQNVKLPTFFINNYFSYGRKFSASFFQSYILGYSYQQQKLLSAVDLVLYNNDHINPSDSFANNFSLHKSKAYFNINNEWHKANLKLTLNLPINYFQFGIDKNTIKKVLVNPQLAARYELGNENSLIASLYSRNYFGNIQTLYKGFIVQNYRNIAANSGEVSQIKANSVSVGFNYKKSAKIFYANILVTYATTLANTITDIFTTAKGDRKILLPLHNTQKNLSLNIGLSKYLFNLGTTVNGKFYIEKSNGYQLINASLQPYISTTTVFNIGASYKMSKWCSIVYSSSLTKNVTKRKEDADKKNQKLFQIRQAIGYYFFPTKKIITNINIDHFYNDNLTTKNKTNIYFADFSIRYKEDKLKTDFEISCTNIFQNKEFYNSILLGNYINDSKVNLNPRILLFKIFFKF